MFDIIYLKAEMLSKMRATTAMFGCGGSHFLYLNILLQNTTKQLDIFVEYGIIILVG